MDKPRSAFIYSDLFCYPEWRTVDKNGYFEMVYVIEYSAYEKLKLERDAAVEALKAYFQIENSADEIECDALTNFFEAQARAVLAMIERGEK